MKHTLVASIAVLASALTGLAATTTTVSFGGNNPSLEGWTINASTGGEFNNGSAWAIFGVSEATRGLGAALNLGETVSIDLASLGVAPGDFVGVDFTQGSTSAVGYNFQGGLANYNVFDNAGVTATSIPFTSGFQTISLTNEDGTNYTLDVDGQDFSVTLASGATGIDGIRIFNETSGVGNDVLFNNFSITTIPEPTTTLLGSLGFLLILRRRR